ncbi:UNVERIFIED_CONTAM: protein TRACHEARY ELEMENT DIFFERENTIATION-RELATED 6 [Sesamum latifolium]|uniref:Protein TRACHEARY ELEMENT DIFFERENTIATION-RELATED 6 n=1 Tax=Sesamum latifolium TaxID=2727402 RepID=A0AAW2WE49_9LAMI
MASFPHFPTPPPFRPVTPPPHAPPPPPPSSPDNGPTVIVIVFISFGSVFFLALCLFTLWCLIKKRKKKAVEETDIIRTTDKHLRVKEAIVEGPHGPETVVLSIEEDKHTKEEIVKNEKVEGEDMVAKSGQTTATDPVAGESSSKPSIHQTHHLVQHKN